MKAPSDKEPTKNFTREMLIGMGEASVRKSYYPELQQRMVELERFRLLLDQARDPIFLVDLADGLIVDANAAARRCVGWKQGGVPAAGIREELGFDPLAALADGDGAEERTLSCNDGRRLTVELSCSRADIDGGSYGIIVARDIGERKEAQERLRSAHDQLQANYLELEELYGQLAAADDALKMKMAELEASNKALAASETRYRLAVEGANDGIWDWDVISNRLTVSAAWSGISGLPAVAVEQDANLWWERIHPEDIVRAEAALDRHLAGKSSYYEVEYRFLITAGRWIWVLAKGKALFEDGRAVRVAGSLTDITPRKETEERIRYMAFNDPQTELLNRAGFNEALAGMIAAARAEARSGAVFLLDIDNFKMVNDSRGHAFGDEVLLDIAARLKASLPPEAAVARPGGDEFLAAFFMSEPNQYLYWAERIMQVFDRPAFVRGTQVMVSCSLGIAPLSGRSLPGELLRKADTAMHSAKAAGKRTWRLFEQYMEDAIQRRMRIEAELHRALAADEFRLHYQPQLCLATGRVIGFEALIRWARGGEELVNPLDFIPVAEETGLIVPIGEWVLRAACRFGHLAAKSLGEPVRVAVNVSPRQIGQANFVDRVCRILAEEAFPPERLEVEITESAMIESFELSVEKLRSLRAQGVRVALDDFGTGYSSLTYLSRLPADVLKIDRSFLREAGADPASDAIVGTIIKLAHQMKLSVTAEGVENEQQQKMLATLGCDCGQGFHFSRPVAGEQALAWLLARVGAEDRQG